ncbi:MAG: ABC transporter permease [Nitrospinota bacterium]
MWRTLLNLTGTICRRYGDSVAGIVGIILFWQLLVWAAEIPTYVLPSPATIGKVIAAKWPLLWKHTVPTLWEVLLGFFFSVALGIPIATGIVYSKLFAKVAYKLLVSSQTIPKVALAPIIVIWFGFGITSKVVVAFLIAFFPVVISAVVGMNSIEPEMLYLARSLGAGPLQSFLRFRFPKALPSIFGGLKVAITLSVVGAVVGEFIAANKGLGNLIIEAGGVLETELVFATVIVLSAMGIALFSLISFAERILVKGVEMDIAAQLGATM